MYSFSVFVGPTPGKGARDALILECREEKDTLIEILPLNAGSKNIAQLLSLNGYVPAGIYLVPFYAKSLSLSWI